MVYSTLPEGGRGGLYAGGAYALMDILTEKGQESLKQERDAVNLFRRVKPSFDFIETPKDKPASLDGFIYRGTELIAGVEVKCRNMTVWELKRQFAGKWLVTHDKILRGQKICEGLCVPLKGFLYLVPDRLLLIVPIWDPELGYQSDIEVMESETQATINGGRAKRVNAYIDTSKAVSIVEAIPFKEAPSGSP